MKWQKWELKLIDKAVENINVGSSIYSQVLRLWKTLTHRTWESIRSKINRKRKDGKSLKQTKC